MGLVIAVGVLTLLAMLPLGFRLRYDRDGFYAGLILGPVTLQIYPKPEKKKESPPKTKKKKTAKAAPKKKEKTGGKLSDFQEIISRILQLLRGFRFWIRRLELHVTLAGDDPAELACNYGRACAVAGGLLPLLERGFRIRRRRISANCDFTAEETVVYFFAEGVIGLGKLLWLLGVHGIAILRAYLKLMKSRKGGSES